MSLPAFVLNAILCANAAASGAFLVNIRKAQSRSEPSEQALYYSRALDAWTADDGGALQAAALFGRGKAKYALDSPRQAVDDLSRTLALDPNNDNALLYRGLAYLRLSRGTAAQSDLSAYAQLAREDKEGWLALGEAEENLGRLPQAASAYEQAAQIDSSDSRARLGLARVWARRKQWLKALDILSQVKKSSHGRSAELLAERAACESALGRRDQALADYDKALTAFDEKLFTLNQSGAWPIDIAQCQKRAAEVYAERAALGGEDPKPAAAPKIKRSKPVKSNAGDRIYAN